MTCGPASYVQSHHVQENPPRTSVVPPCSFTTLSVRTLPVARRPPQAILASRSRRETPSPVTAHQWPTGRGRCSTQPRPHYCMDCSRAERKSPPFAARQRPRVRRRPSIAATDRQLPPPTIKSHCCWSTPPISSPTIVVALCVKLLQPDWGFSHEESGK